MENNVIFFNEIDFENNFFHPESIGMLMGIFPYTAMNDFGFVLRYKKDEKTFNKKIFQSFGVKASIGFVCHVCPECGQYTDLNTIWDSYIISCFCGRLWTSCNHPITTKGLDVDNL